MSGESSNESIIGTSMQLISNWPIFTCFNKLNVSIHIAIPRGETILNCRQRSIEKTEAYKLYKI